MADEQSTGTEPAQDAELISRLRVIENQPLAERADAYAALHDELARELEQKGAAPTMPPRA
ncbi:hypothetical protein [Microbacterium sp.]|uniref:hypothetical protein n=1 Tax=Microbacterium sp. TaxID=51671 RepID=UPI003A91383E